MNSLFKLFILVIAGTFIAGCKSGEHQCVCSNSTDVKTQISLMMANISRDVSAKASVAWLDYFQNSPDFFMASAGSLAFKDNNAAKEFILNNLVKSIKKISLSWSDVRIDPISNCSASIGAKFHEDIAFANESSTSENGYFTGTALLKEYKWKLLNLHWSITAAFK